MEKKRRTRAGSVALYVLAVVLLCYGAYMVFQSYEYVASYYEYQGSSVTENLGDMFQYIISQSYAYICFAIVFYAMGLLLQKMNDLHDFLPRDYLHPKEIEEEDVEWAMDAEERSGENETVVEGGGEAPAEMKTADSEESTD